MARARAATPASIDLARTEPVLFFTGGAVPDHVPARDLTAADLVRIHRIAALTASGGDAVDGPGPEELEALATELSDSGAFAREAAALDEPPVLIDGDTLTEPTTEGERPAAPAEQET